MPGSEIAFRIADTFTGSLAKLTGKEQKAVKTTAFDLQMNPSHPGMQFHKLDRAKDKNFWSVRVSRDLRLIVHKSGSNLLLCYVDHHDAAYRWAESRRLEKHPRTGAAQIVEIREMVREIEVPRYIDAESPPTAVADEPRKIFTDVSDDELLGYGVPVEWLDDVKAATEDSLLDLSEHLPAEASEALLELATGDPRVQPPMDVLREAPALQSVQAMPRAEPVSLDRQAPITGHEDPFAHPDAQRRFRVMANVEELRRALAHVYPPFQEYLYRQ